MKRLLILALILLFACTLTACGLLPNNDKPKEDVITVEDGYLVVNGVKTGYEVKTSELVVVSVIDGYLVVNGNKTAYKVDDGKEPELKEDVITVVDGYLAVNGTKTEYKVEATPIISVIDGYLAVNGVKTQYAVALGCNHIWNTVTTSPTCSKGGYDTMTCLLCDKSVKVNETASTPHTYAPIYSIDNNYHWYKCTGCTAAKDKELHTLDDEDVCTVCQLPVSSTPGVVYGVSTDGTYAEVIDYTGTATKVKIAEEYEGLPVKEIYDSAFYDNDNITSVVIPDSVTSIGTVAFYSCDSLTSVVIPDSVTSIGWGAFYNCTSLTSVVIGDSVTSIGFVTFYSCSSLTSVVIGDSVTSIDNAAFSYCSSLTSVVIGDSVTSIGEWAFAHCTSLTSVVIPDSVTSIGKLAFDNSSALTDVYYTGTEAQWANISIGSSNSPITNATKHYNYVPDEN